MAHNANDVWYQPVKIEPESPCTNLCVISSHTGICIGCFRSLKEIVAWETASPGEKVSILENSLERKAKYLE